jgi:hypothetical protein
VGQSLDAGVNKQARPAVIFARPGVHQEAIMKFLKLAAIVVALGLCDSAYSAAATTTTDEPGVTITSPAEGAKVGLAPVKLSYESAPSPKGDHVHIFVDGERTATVRQLKGTFTVDKLAIGKHWLCVRVVDKGNTPVGQEKCVGVIAGDIPPMRYRQDKANKADTKADNKADSNAVGK